MDCYKVEVVFKTRVAIGWLTAPSGKTVAYLYLINTKCDEGLDYVCRTLRKNGFRNNQPGKEYSVYIPGEDIAYIIFTRIDEEELPADRGDQPPIQDVDLDAPYVDTRVYVTHRME